MFVVADSVIIMGNESSWNSENQPPTVFLPLSLISVLNTDIYINLAGLERYQPVQLFVHVQRTHSQTYR